MSQDVCVCVFHVCPFWGCVPIDSLVWYTPKRNRAAGKPMNTVVGALSSPAQNGAPDHGEGGGLGVGVDMLDSGYGYGFGFGR